MSVGYDPDAVPEPKAVADLLKPGYKGKVAIDGDPTQAGSAFAAVGLATVQNKGTADDFQAGMDFFSKLNAAGNLLKIDATPATIASGETPVLFDWDHLNVGYGKPSTGTGTPSDSITVASNACARCRALRLAPGPAVPRPVAVRAVGAVGISDLRTVMPCSARTIPRGRRTDVSKIGPTGAEEFRSGGAS